jgi:hypothetical protein
MVARPCIMVNKLNIYKSELQIQPEAQNKGNHCKQQGNIEDCEKKWLGEVAKEQASKDYRAQICREVERGFRARVRF